MPAAPRPLIQTALVCVAPRPAVCAPRPTTMGRVPTAHAAAPSAQLIQVAAISVGTAPASLKLTSTASLAHQCNAVSQAKVDARHCTPPPVAKTPRAAMWCVGSIPRAARVRGINSACNGPCNTAAHARWHVQQTPPQNRKHVARATTTHVKALVKPPRRWQSLAAAHAGN